MSLIIHSQLAPISRKAVIIWGGFSILLIITVVVTRTTHSFQPFFYQKKVLCSMIHGPMALIQLQVPDDAEIGDSLTFAINGKELEIPVPDGSVPGDILQIEIDYDGDDDHEDSKKDPSTTSHEKDTLAQNEMLGDKAEPQRHIAKEADNFKIPLHESLGITLEMICSITAGTSPKKENKNEGNDETKQHTSDGLNELKSAESPQHLSDGTFAMAWPAGIHLAKCISSPSFNEFTKHKKSVVEIGSGLGLVGLSFMTTASHLLSHRKNDVKKLKLALTDLPNVLPIIRHNVEHNIGKISSISNGNISVESLIWGDESSIPSMAGEVDLILASDILYNATIKTYESLCKSISLLLKKDGTTSQTSSDNSDTVKVDTIVGTSECHILLAVRWRKPEEERKFFELMESKLKYKFDLILDSIDDSAYKCDLGWREFGNPNCSKSNEYFTHTHVKVREESIALKDITEAHMDNMTEEEYVNFEARYIQIYVGTHM